MLILVIFPTIIFAQRSDVEIEKKGIIYHDEFSIGFRLNTFGWGIFGDVGKQLTVDKKRYMRFEFIELKNPKEFKQPSVAPYTISGSQFQSKPFYFGKQNNFYSVHFSYGFSRVIAEKPSKNGVAVSYNYMFGPAIGILKPYYLDVIYEVNDQPIMFILERQRYSETNKDVFLDPSKIGGASGFSYGLSEISFVPGIQAKFGLSFDWAVYDDVVKVIEVGISVDAYPKKVPILIIENNPMVFANLYLSVQLGRKW